MGPDATRHADLRASIVIPVYGKAELTRQCLESLRATGTFAHAEVIVVDNASPDDTPALCAEWSAHVRTIRNATNEGFAKACNRGARAAQAPVVVLLNNDTIVRDGWLEPLLEAVADPRVGVAGARLLYPNGAVQHAGVTCTSRGAYTHVHRLLPGDHPLVTRSRDLGVVTGACMALRREVFAALGGFHEEFINGFEDVDLCVRLGEAGYVARYCADSVITHYESVTRGVDPNLAHNTALLRLRCRQAPADHAQVLADDGIGTEHAQVIWFGPVTGTSAGAEAGRRAITQLTRRGRHVLAVTPDEPDVAPTEAFTAEVVAALNRGPLGDSASVVVVYLDAAEIMTRGEHGTVVVVHPSDVDVGDDSPADAVIAWDGGDDLTDLLESVVSFPPHPGIGLHGDIDGRDARARTTRAVTRAVRASGRPVAVTPTGPDSRRPRSDDAGHDWFFPDVWVLMGSPARCGTDPGWRGKMMHSYGHYVGYCWSDGLAVPREWVSAVEIADAVWVPSPAGAAPFLASGVPAERLRVVRPPVDPAVFRPGEPPAGPVRLLALPEWSWFGGWDVLLRAYCTAFAREAPVTLTLAVDDPAIAEGAVLDRLAADGIDVDMIPDLHLVERPDDDEALAELMRTHHAFVSAARGDGVGLDRLRALHSGLVVVATQATAHGDLDPGDAALRVAGGPTVRYHGAGQDPRAGLEVREPSAPALAAALRWCVDQVAPARQRALAAVPAVRQACAQQGLVAALTDAREATLERPRAVV